MPKRKQGVVRAIHSARFIKTPEYKELLNDYNNLVDEYNELESETALVSYFVQGVSETAEFSPSEKITRGFNIALYMSNGKNSTEAALAIEKIVEALGHSVVYEKEKIGSFFKRLTTISKNLLSRDDVKKDIEKLKRFVENSTVSKSQADIDGVLATAVAQLLQATSDEETILFFGSFVVVKTLNHAGRFQSVVKTLTTEEQMVIATEQSLLTNPSSFFKLLELKASEYKQDLSVLNESDKQNIKIAK